MAIRSDITSSGCRIHGTATGLGTSAELGPFRVPVEGDIVRVSVTRVDGTGTTVDPAAGRRASWASSTVDEVFADSSQAPAAHVSEAQAVPYFAPTGELWLRPGLDAGSDNVVAVELLIRRRGDL